MSIRRERVVLDTTGVEEFPNHYARMRYIAASWARNDRARREHPLYAADPKAPGPQVWEGDDS